MNKAKKKEIDQMKNAIAPTSGDSSQANSALIEREKLATDEIEFLKYKMADEERRRGVIEGKTGQLFGQVGVVISVVALFIPLISHQVNDFPTWMRIVFIVLFLMIVICFITAIWIASSSWIIYKYGYLRPDLSDLYECGKPETHIAFNERYSSLLSEAIPQHINVNNGKGTNLIRAGIAYRFGILLLGIFVVALAVALSIIKPTDSLSRNPMSVIAIVKTQTPLNPKATQDTVRANK